MSKFGSHSDYVLAYAQHLAHLNDEQNTRSLFERALQQVKTDEAFDIWRAYLDYETQYGDLQTVLQLEKRFKQAYPNGTRPRCTEL